MLGHERAFAARETQRKNCCNVNCVASSSQTGVKMIKFAAAQNFSWR